MVRDDEAALLVYDGDCRFCSTTAEWTATKWTRPRLPEAVPWQQLGQSGMERVGPTERDVTRAAWWVDNGRPQGGHLALSQALIAAGDGWRWAGRLLRVPPVACLAALGYAVMARNRHRLPGGSPACRSARPSLAVAMRYRSGTSWGGGGPT